MSEFMFNHRQTTLCVWLMIVNTRRTKSMRMVNKSTLVKSNFVKKDASNGTCSEKNTTNKLISISFHFTEIFSLRYNLDMQFSELH